MARNLNCDPAKSEIRDFSSTARAVFFLILTLFIAARLWRLTAYSVRADEIFSIHAAQQSWVDLIRYVIRDIVHPPLYYSLLRVWLLIGGDSEGWLRLFPVLTAIAAVCPFFLLCRELKLEPFEINVAFFLFAVNGYLIYFAQELRMYSLLLLLTLASLWLFAKWLNSEVSSPGNFAALFVINLLVVFTQYYGWIVVAGELFLLLLRQPHRSVAFASSVAILVLCFSPWALKVARAAIAIGGLESNIGSFARPTLGDLAELYASFNGPLFSSRYGMVIGQSLFLLPVVLWARHICKGDATENRSAMQFLLLVVFSVLPIFVSFIVSQIAPQSVWGTRFFVNAAVPYVILVATAACRLKPVSLRNTALALMIGWASLAGIHELNHTDKRAWEPLVYRMIHAENSRRENIMIYAFGSSDETIEFYLRKAGDRRFRTKRVFSLDVFPGNHFWVASRSKEEWPQPFFTSRGYRVGQGFPDGFGALLSPVWR